MAVFRDERSEEHPRYSRRIVESYRVTGLERGLETLDLLYALDPDMAELFSQYVRGGLYSRDVLPQATRELCACAALATLDKQPQLRSHLLSGAAHGATKEQLLEAVFQSITYGGAPAMLNSVKTYADIFPEMVRRDRAAIPASPGEPPTGPRYPPAVETATRLYGAAYAEEMFARYDRWDPAYSRLAQRFVFGGMYARAVVDAGLRELMAVACLTVRNALPQLETHLRMAFHLGLPRAQIQEVILQMSVYAGFPYMVQAMATFERVANEAEAG